MGATHAGTDLDKIANVFDDAACLNLPIKIPQWVFGGDGQSPLIPVIPFFAEIGRIGETGETAPEVRNVLATRINTG
jgi:hypothetical protein